MEPRFNDLRFNNIPGITINICFPGKSYSKMYGEFVPQTQNLSLLYNDKINMTPQEMLNILVCSPSALSSLPFNSFFSLNIFEGLELVLKSVCTNLSDNMQ